jgi:predicted phage terminase large subunit-like protein
LLAKGGWEHICIPAEAPQDLIYDSAGRKIRFRAGNILDPRRISRENLDEFRRNMGSFAYSAQYLQEPAPADGNVFHWSWLRFFDPSEIDLAQTPYVFQAWDVATTASSKADFSVCTTWAVFEKDDLCLIDVLRVQLELPALVRCAADHFDRFKPDLALVEATGVGIGFWQTLHEMRGERIRRAHTKFDKHTRAMKVTPTIERGCVSVPTRAPWLDALRREFNGFPATKNDDQVDSIVMFWSTCRG